MATPPDTIAAAAEALAEEVARLKKRLERERTIRREAEAIAERGLRDLYNRQRELQTLERIADRANQGGSIRDVLEFSIAEICRLHGWKVGHAYRVRQRGEDRVLVSGNIWFEAEERFRPFHRVSRHAEFLAGHGLPGRAMEMGRPVWVADLTQDENFPRLGICLACGLKSAVAFPVLSGSHVVAVLEFYDTEMREPGEGLLEMLHQAGTQLGRVIERQHAQAALKVQTRELEKARDEALAADHAKSAFLAAMSHELRTPLNAIIGFSDLMLHEIGGPLLPRYKDYAADIQKSGEHLKNIINDILDLSKVAVGEMQLRDAPVAVATLVENCERIVRPLAAVGKVALTCTVASGLPWLQADETRLQQTILNLLANAVKFTPLDGAVTLQAGRADDGSIFVAITDTGIGMSREEIAIALEPFRQIDSALSRRYEGTGLGLPLAKAFAELHGGSLEIDSVPSVGTTVRLMLPAARCLRAVA